MLEFKWRVQGSRFLSSVMILGAMAPLSMATIQQLAQASYWADPAGTGASNTDGESFSSPPDPLTDLLASISGPGYSATTSFGRFGNLGMQASMTSGGRLRTVAKVECDEFVNLAGTARNAKAQFIIDGGSLRLLGGAVAKLSFQIDLTAQIYDAGGNVVSISQWQSFNELTSVDFGAVTLSKLGEDIGVNVIGSFEAEIPLSLQTFEMGSVPAGGHIDLSYQADIIGYGDVMEICRWTFSDPLNVEGFGEAPTVIFDPVPEPAAMAILGLGSIGLIRRRRKR